jgi:hypothetical protein
VLATSRALPHEEGGEHGLGAEGGRVVVGHGHPHELGRTAEALQMLDAAHGLEHRIVARPIAVGPVGTEGGHGAVDQARIEGAQGGRVHAEALGHAGAHVLDEHVGRLDQTLQHLAPRRLLEIDGDRALAAIPAVEAGELAEGVALQRLHLDDARSQVGEHHGAVGPREIRRAVQHGDAVEGSARVGHQRADVT